MTAETATVLRDALLKVVDTGTARRLERIAQRDWQIGGKTGTGDHKLVTVDKRGRRTNEVAVSRSATFAFFLEERFFGTMTAFVQGERSGEYTFTSSLPVTLIGHMLPLLDPLVEPPIEILNPDSETFEDEFLEVSLSPIEPEVTP